ncbi:unnamed protein product [Gongylonema pulchrum]|uniref:Coiled-coil domain-containing protein 6 n=1 Tax=Gongylonema pulchrum TaxID=637853 RepID=A0A183CW48_9BILA|nr:unnamed protein product [Gongylonema pulchrum]
MHANDELRADYCDLSEKLALARKTHEDDLEKLRYLEQIQAQVKSSLNRAKIAEKAAAEAKADRDQAELEAAECRKQAERMLEITNHLTDKNSSLTSQQEMLETKNLELAKQVKTLESSLSTYEGRTMELEGELHLLKIDNDVKVGMLKQQIIDSNTKEKELNLVISELRGELEVVKKKNASTLKELRAELQYLRKLQLQNSNPSPPTAVVEDTLPPSAHCSEIYVSCRSGASSVASSGDLPTNPAPPPPPPTRIDIRHGEPQQSTIISLPTDETSHAHQQMVEKIVKLQRQLARRQDKIEFLEEHVRQCTQELLKKTK